MAKKAYIGVNEYSLYNSGGIYDLDVRDIGDYVYAFNSLTIDSKGYIVPDNPELVSYYDLVDDVYFIEQDVFESEPLIYVYQVLFPENGGVGNHACSILNTRGTGEVARKIKKGYIGINGVARKIKKAYIGIGGVARPCWGGGVLAYYGTVTELSVARSRLAATTVGDYALFGGGYTSTYQNEVDAYNKSLTRTIPTALVVTRSYLAATTVGDYALFGGGTNGSSTARVDAYDTSLIQTKTTSLSYTRYFLAATTIGDYALFGGGTSANNTNGRRSTVDAYDRSLTRTIPTELSVARSHLAATTVGDYALFGGGTGSGLASAVDAYTVA